MADNTVINLGSGGDTIASDDISGVKYQRVKLVYGMDGINDGDARIPTTFKTSTATASGDTVVWTPTSGKKFRVMRYSVEVTADAATSGGAEIDIVLRDATTALGFGVSLYVPAVGGTTFGNNYNSGWRDVGNGFLSAAANNVLNVNLSAALTAGKVRVNVAGTEE